MSDSTSLVDWLAAQRRAQQCVVRPISLEDSTQWSWVEGRIQHHTGRFFSVVGVEDAQTGWLAPLLEQREIGTLAFIRREYDGDVQLLVQAKLEPGDLGLSQIAPSVQATASNLDRVHGGASQPFAELVTADPNAHVDALGSEQGTRFLGKFNRNVLVTAEIAAADLPGHLKWFPARELLRMLHDDHAINTDARSVLVSSPWELLVGDEPFASVEGAWSRALRESYRSTRAGVSEAAKDSITSLRTDAEPTWVSLDDLQGWSVDRQGQVTVKGGAFCVRQIDIKTNAREVEAWDQPIIDTAEAVTIDLAVCVEEGVAYFGLAPVVEPGLVNRAVWGHSVGLATSGKVVASVAQSDEGGRFFQDVAHYRLVLIERSDAEPGLTWLTLGELQPLLAEGGWLTNEVRSALSLLLYWI